LDIGAGTATDIGTVRRALDTACEELGLTMPGLDVAARERLVERILALLAAPPD
jgi:hypothetical protein